MKHVLISGALLVMVAACVAPEATDPAQPATAAPKATETAAAAAAKRPNARAQDVAQTAAPDATPVAAPAPTRAESGGGYLGLTITSLGDATEPGNWMKTPLVTKPTTGLVEYPATGAVVQVKLLPLPGPKSAGSQLSLAAFRQIKAPITGLPELKVYKAGS